MPQPHPEMIAAAYFIALAVAAAMVVAILMDRRALLRALARLGKGKAGE